MLKMDKVAHFGLGGMITACMALISILQEDLSVVATLLCPFIGHVCVFILSVIKEYVIDSTKDWNDIIVGMIGSFVAHLAVALGVLFGSF